MKKRHQLNNILIFSHNNIHCITTSLCLFEMKMVTFVCLLSLHKQLRAVLINDCDMNALINRMNTPLTINCVCAKQTTGEDTLRQFLMPNKTEIEREIMTKVSLRYNYMQIFLDPSWSLNEVSRLPATRIEEHFMWPVFFWIIQRYGFLPYILTELWRTSLNKRIWWGPPQLKDIASTH